MKLKVYFQLPVFVLVMTCPAFANPKFDLMLDDLLDGTVPQISTDELAALLAGPDADKAVLLDTRSEREYKVSHLRNAKRLGFRDFSLEKLEGIARDSPVIVYCSVGKRSEMIGEKLEKAGFSKVRNLRGGIFQWANDSHPIANSDGPTDAVHSYNKKWGRWLDATIEKVK